MIIATYLSFSVSSQVEVTGAVEEAVGPRESPALTSSPRIVCSVGGVVSVGFVGMQ